MTSTQPARTDNVVVELDGDQYTYPAHDSGQRWNGWAVPAFSRATLELLISREADVDQVADADRLAFDGDTLVLSLGQTEGESERIEPGADGYYSTEAFGWTWAVVGPLVRLTLGGRTVTVTMHIDADLGEPRVQLEPADGLFLEGVAPADYLLVAQD